MNEAILLISCQDQKGITAAVTDFVFRHQGNIHHADQHIDDQANTFFMRIVWSLDGFALDRSAIADAFREIAGRFSMKWTLSFSDERIRVAVFVSRPLHCLYDLLYRHSAGQLSCEIPLIVSNHPGGKSIAGSFGIPYHEFTVTRENKAEVEQTQMDLLARHNTDCVVLARYHQILSPEFVNAYDGRIINIHHSFLPAFVGQKPYDQAYEKGVKIIGATSHYVNEELDQGPIIEQDTVRISHRDTVADLKHKGEDLEKAVLARALRWHLQRKILCYRNKTVVFD